MRYLIVIPFLTVGLLLSGCGQKTSPVTNQPVAPVVRPQAERPVKKPVTILISIKDKRFLPQLINAQVGDTVKWINEDSLPHTVTGGDFNSPKLAKGETYQVTLTKPGTIDYACTIHPDMKGRVVVQPAP